MVRVGVVSLLVLLLCPLMVSAGTMVESDIGICNHMTFGGIVEGRSFAQSDSFYADGSCIHLFFTWYPHIMGETVWVGLHDCFLNETNGWMPVSGEHATIQWCYYVPGEYCIRVFNASYELVHYHGELMY